MELTVLAAPGCPNAPVLERRLGEVLADRPAVTMTRRVITSAVQAARWGMHGSPTLLINGLDPFAVPGTEPSVACRLYPAGDGRLDGAPTVAALRLVLEPGELPAVRRGSVVVRGPFPCCARRRHPVRGRVVLRSGHQFGGNRAGCRVSIMGLWRNERNVRRG